MLTQRMMIAKILFAVSLSFAAGCSQEERQDQRSRSNTAEGDVIVSQDGHDTKIEESDFANLTESELNVVIATHFQALLNKKEVPPEKRAGEMALTWQMYFRYLGNGANKRDAFNTTIDNRDIQLTNLYFRAAVRMRLHACFEASFERPGTNYEIEIYVPRAVAFGAAYGCDLVRKDAEKARWAPVRIPNQQKKNNTYVYCNQDRVFGDDNSNECNITINVDNSKKINSDNNTIKVGRNSVNSGNSTINVGTNIDD